MPGQPAHFEIPADDTAKGRQFWGSLFDWQFEASPRSVRVPHDPHQRPSGRGDHQHGARQARHSHLLLRGRHQRRRRGWRPADGGKAGGGGLPGRHLMRQA